ncbi:antitoxin MqsA [bacterium BMS3Bbin09]|nr:antitoxin MqsA [bacterium BMS3Bbin09]HDH34686.1 type II toxin-antitoxin system MqsA family antitoxin [Nitrospirota bacterium]
MYKKGDNCPVCSKGSLSEQVITEEFEYKRKKIQVPNYHVFSCNNCKEELVSPKTIRETEKILTDFRRRIDGLLTSSEIKDIRKKIGKTQTEMSSKFGVSPKTFARYENGQVTQSKSMDILLRIININPFILEDIYSQTRTNYEVLGKPSVPCCKEPHLQITYKVRKRAYKGFVKEAEFAA